MEKVLNQREIDAMVQAARSGGGAAPPAQAPVELWDVRRAGQIGREQLQALTLLHEGFARNLTNSLGAYLRVVFAATLVSAEHLAYREFLQRIPETTYLASCRLDPTGVSAALQLDLKVAFPIIDLLLGGEGKSAAISRETTEIEGQILESVARIVCREMSRAWQSLALDVVFEERLDTGAARQLMLGEEKTLSLSFEVTMPEVRGGLNLALPASVSNALLRKISDERGPKRPRGVSEFRHRLMRRLLDCQFPAELAATDVPMAVGAIANFVPGQVFTLLRDVAAPASLVVGGVEMFHARPARCENARAAKVMDRVSPPDGDSPGSKEKLT